MCQSDVNPVIHANLPDMVSEYTHEVRIMKKLLTLCVVSITLMFMFIGQAADKHRYEVSVIVDCADKNTKLFIESHIKRELRALGDIDVTKFDLDNDFSISIMAIVEKKTLNSVIISSTIYKYFDDETINSLINLQDNPESLKLALNYGLGARTNVTLQVGATKRLDEMCKNLVVSFDIDLLEPLR